MTDRMLPWLVDPAELIEHIDAPSLRIIDLSPSEVFREHHAPGACHLAYSELVVNRPPIGGLVPERSTLEATFSRLGIGPRTHVAAMDAEGGGAAGRLIWTLELLGHEHVSLVDGGLRAWVEEGFPIERGPGVPPASASFSAASPTPPLAADAPYILEHLGKHDIGLLDARSADEYSGRVARVARGGHIPGAVHFEWLRGMDRKHNLRMRPRDILREELASIGLTPDREIITYCQTHHRSAFSYAMLRILGFPRIRGYPGSWSDWGNRDDTPVEQP